MSYSIPDILTFIALAAGGLLGIGIAFNFLCWLAEALYQKAADLIDLVTGLLIAASQWAGGYLQKFIAGLIAATWSLIQGAWLLIYQPPALLLIRGTALFGEYVRLRSLYGSYGHREFDSFAKFKRHMRGEPEPEPKPRKKPEKPSPEKSEYVEALEVLGFTEADAFDKKLLKARYREIANVIHPDKQFKNRIFFQQLQDAVQYIERARKW